MLILSQEADDSTSALDEFFNLVASLKQSKKICKLIDSFNGMSKQTVWVMEQRYNCCSLPGVSLFRLAQLTL